MQEKIITSLSPEEFHKIIFSATLGALRIINEGAYRSQIEDEDPLSIDEAAEFSKIPKATIYYLTASKKIPFHKRGKRLYFFKRELIEWIEKSKTQKEVQP